MLSVIVNILYNIQIKVINNHIIVILSELGMLDVLRMLVKVLKTIVDIAVMIVKNAVIKTLFVFNESILN